MNRKDKQLLMKLNFAAGILHVHGIISQMQRDQIHRKLMKLRDKMEAKPKTPAPRSRSASTRHSRS